MGGTLRKDLQAERQRKLEAGRARFAQYRQRKARHNGQNPKKQKKKKLSSLNINQQNDETSINSSQCIESARNPDSTRMRALPSGQIENHDQVFDEDLRFPLEDQKQRNTQLDALLGQQRQLLNELQQKIESQEMLYAQLGEEQGRNIELWALLESKKVRVQEMKDTLDKEQELHAQLQSSGDGGQPRPVFPPEKRLQELQKQLEEKQKHRVGLVNETQKYKLDSLRTKYQVEKDRQVHQKTLQMEKEANTLGQRKREEWRSKVEELQRKLQEKKHQLYKLDLERKRLQGIMQEFQKQEREEKRGSRRLVYQNINKQATWNFTDNQTRNWVLQQKMEEEAKSTSYTKPIELNGGNIINNNNLELTRQKLLHVATKHQHGDQKACNSLEFEVSDEDVLTRVRERIDQIIFRLERLTDQPDPGARPCFPPSSGSPPLRVRSTAPSSAPFLSVSWKYSETHLPENPRDNTYQDPRRISY